MLNNVYFVVIIILTINIVYVSFSTVRMILTLKGRRYLAALVSMVEVVVYILGLSIVLENLNGIQNIIAYAVGYGLGIIIGSMIEEKLALGYITVNVVSTHPELDFTELRKKGYGVTSWLSSGMDGDRVSMQILTPRKQELQLYEAIHSIDPKAFIVSYEPKHIEGGFWVKQVRKGVLFKNNKQAELKPTSAIQQASTPHDSEKLEHFEEEGSSKTETIPNETNIEAAENPNDEAKT